MNNIDKIISEQFDLVKAKITKDNLTTLCEFDLNDLESLKEKTQVLRKIKGIYLFEIHNQESLLFDEWIEGFTNKFRGFENKYLQKWTPNIVGKRTKIHKNQSSSSEWIPLYLGKSQNIADRIDKHLNSKLGYPPSALKLKHRGNLNDERFRIQYIDFSYIRNYEAIVGLIEKKLREEINPIAGR
tara:strand:- start:455 stop:1009 length:555 start_codon:yes stop_codon:yes gene_type:complete